MTSIHRGFLTAISALGLLAPVPGRAADPIYAGYGTVVPDGSLGPGEWDAVTPRPVFTALSGSYLYVVNDEVNLYLGLWVPDATFTGTDQFRVRIDSAHDSLAASGDDELGLVAPSAFDDFHFNSGFWGVLDVVRNGTGMAATSSGGNFFEMAHPLNSGDSRDMAIAPGDTIGLCLRYFNDNFSSSGDIYPPDCTIGLYQQRLYVDVITATNAVAVHGGREADRGLAVFPNPAAPGSAVEFRYTVPEGGARVELAIYSVRGRRMILLDRGHESGGVQRASWATPPSGPGSWPPGLYFARVRYDGGPVETRPFVLR